MSLRFWIEEQGNTLNFYDIIFNFIFSSDLVHMKDLQKEKPMSAQNHKSYSNIINDKRWSLNVWLSFTLMHNVLGTE